MRRNVVLGTVILPLVRHVVTRAISDEPVMRRNRVALGSPCTGVRPGAVNKDDWRTVACFGIGKFRPVDNRNLILGGRRDGCDIRKVRATRLGRILRPTYGGRFSSHASLI
jgi:hypothetical protein